MFQRVMSIAAAALAILAVAAGPAAAKSKQEKAENLIVKAADTVAYFADDSAFAPLWELADDAKAMVIIPRSFRGGFIFGASGGNAVMIARNKDGSWSEPTFFTIGSVSFGFQAGGESSETILAVMTQRGMERLLSTTVKVGADVSLAAGSLGAGAKAQTADILAFSRSRGLYGGVSLEGAVLKSRRSWNEAYYGTDATPAEIIFQEAASRPQSALLQNAVWALAHRDEAPMLAPTQGVAPNAAPTERIEIDPITGEPMEPVEDGETVYEDDAVYGAPLTGGQGN